MAKPSYITFAGFVAVLTPHFVERFMERRDLLADGGLSNSFIMKVWAAAPIGHKACARLGKALVYVNKKWNEKRSRWELEFVSLTPAHFVNTVNHSGQKLLAI
jgi:hypothetical protein